MSYSFWKQDKSKTARRRLVINVIGFAITLFTVIYLIWEALR
jgi:hypothetical protein